MSVEQQSKADATSENHTCLHQANISLFNFLVLSNNSFFLWYKKARVLYYYYLKNIDLHIIGPPAGKTLGGVKMSDIGIDLKFDMIWIMLKHWKLPLAFIGGYNEKI